MQEYVIELSKYFIAFFIGVIYGKLFLYLSDIRWERSIVEYLFYRIF